MPCNCDYGRNLEFRLMNSIAAQTKGLTLQIALSEKNTILKTALKESKEAQERLLEELMRYRNADKLPRICEEPLSQEVVAEVPDWDLSSWSSHLLGI